MHCGWTHFAVTPDEVCAQRQDGLHLSFCRSTDICVCTCNTLLLVQDNSKDGCHSDLAVIPLGCDLDQVVLSPCSKAAA